jgi:CHAD domain-containing protein
MSSTSERELKLGAPSDFQLARLQTPLGRFAVSPVELERLHTAYYDTADLRLARWSCSLRFRHGEGWTLKVPAPTEAAGLSRTEHIFPGDESHVPEGALDLATAYLRGAQLIRVAELRTLRTSRQLLEGGFDVASIVEDDVRVIERDRVMKRFRQIEIELAERAPDALLEDLGDELRRHGAGKPDPAPKNVRAIGRRACRPEIESGSLRRNPTIGDVVRAAFAGSVGEIIRYDAKLRSKPDEESVHHARVAVRRLRSDLRSFLPVLDSVAARELRDRLSWLQDQLSQARDADVFIAELGRLSEYLPDPDRRAVARVLQPFDAERRRQYAKLRTALHEERYVRLLSDIVDLAKHPPFARTARKRAKRLIPELLAESWSTLCKRVRRQDKAPSDRNLHAIRIAAKRVRYLAEAVEPVAGRPARRLAAAGECLQTLLGEQHDAVVARETLHDAANLDPAFILGELAANAHMLALHRCDDWKSSWKDATRRYQALLNRRR